MRPCPVFVREQWFWKLCWFSSMSLCLSLWLCWTVSGWAAESGRLVERDGKYVFVESMDPATKLLLQRAVKSGTITQEEYDTVVRESQERQYLLQPSFKAWYDRGFNFSMNDNDFFLKIRARMAARFT